VLTEVDLLQIPCCWMVTYPYKYNPLQSEGPCCTERRWRRAFGVDNSIEDTTDARPLRLCDVTSCQDPSRVRAATASHPMNAMLNYAYAVLESQVLIAAISQGLDPTIGYLHVCRPGRVALVYA